MIWLDSHFRYNADLSREGHDWRLEPAAFSLRRVERPDAIVDVVVIGKPISIIPGKRLRFSRVKWLSVVAVCCRSLTQTRDWYLSRVTANRSRHKNHGARRSSTRKGLSVASCFAWNTPDFHDGGRVRQERVFLPRHGQRGDPRDLQPLPRQGGHAHQYHHCAKGSRDKRRQQIGMNSANECMMNLEKRYQSVLTRKSSKYN